MAEYIEKHKAVNLLTSLDNEFQQFKPFKCFEHAMYRKLCETEIAIGKLPAADVVPVVHGHWIWHEEEFEYECSACHCRFDYNHMFELFDHGFQYANLCPNCGAKMDGGADND